MQVALQNEVSLLSSDEWQLRYETMIEIIRGTLGEKVLNTLIVVTERRMKEKKKQ